MPNIINQDQLNALFPLAIHIHPSYLNRGDKSCPFNHPLALAIKDKLEEIGISKNHNVLILGVQYVHLTLSRIGSVYLSISHNNSTIIADSIEEDMIVQLHITNHPR